MNWNGERRSRWTFKLQVFSWRYSGDYHLMSSVKKDYGWRESLTRKERGNIILNFWSFFCFDKLKKSFEKFEEFFEEIGSGAVLENHSAMKNPLLSTFCLKKFENKKQFKIQSLIQLNLISYCIAQVAS